MIPMIAFSKEEIKECLSLQRYASRTSEGQTRRALPQNAFAFFADRRQQKAVKDPLVQSHTGELAMAFSI